MRRHLPILRIAIVSADVIAAGDLAERIFEHGQVAYVFADIASLWRQAATDGMDLVLLDRRTPGFAMAVDALRAGPAGHALICEFGAGRAVAPARLDHSFDAFMLDGEISSLLSEAICGDEAYSSRELAGHFLELYEC